MKRNFIWPVFACISGLIFGGCSKPTAPIEAKNAVAPVSSTSQVPKATPVLAPVPAPTLPPIVIQSGKSSLPSERQMLGDRPPGAPLPTPTKGIDFSKDVQISNAPGAGQIARDRPEQSAVSQARARNKGLDFTKGVVISNAPRHSAQALTSEGETRVWVNDRSRVYHRPGSKYYGKTREGHFLGETAARVAGYTLAQNGQ